MSIHRSLKTKGALVRARNVWTRLERILNLQKEGRWQEGDSILGLPKVRTHFKSKTKKQLKEEAAKRAAGGPGEAKAQPPEEEAGKKE